MVYQTFGPVPTDTRADAEGMKERLADLAPRPVTVNETPVPRFTVAEAVDSLNVSGMPFFFFLDTERGRASVLYRRYDGHLRAGRGTGTPPRRTRATTEPIDTPV